VLDRKTGEQKFDSGLGSLADVLKAGNPVIPVGLQLPQNTLVAGAYRLELNAQDSFGRSFKRSTDLDIE
jgi:hypothetical protein